MANFIQWLATAWSFVIIISGQDMSKSSIRDIFTRYSDRRLSALQSEYIDNTTIVACASVCLSETDFQCKSFSYDNIKKSCSLFTVNLQDSDIHLIDSIGRDHYETAYVKKFNLLPKHRLPVSTASRIEPVSVEECARRCVLQTNFNCRAFNYRARQQLCQLLQLTSSNANKAVVSSDDIDYYEKQQEGALESFVNYGMGILNELAGSEVYQRSSRGISVEACAQQCLDENAYRCLSFDFIFDVSEEKSVCHLSKYIAANVHGLVADRDHPTHNHFERVERYLQHFYSTPYAVLSGMNVKTYTKLTPNLCAQMCLQEDSFVCRSFDYEMKQEGSCVLNSKTGSDVGGLNTAHGIRSTNHHFEMKPLLDCGGNLTEPDGGFASPNWPRNYAHHQHCVWSIQVPQNKVILLILTHFELGPLQSSDPCNLLNDRLVVEEMGTGAYCVVANTKQILTASNMVTLSFYSNAQVDAQGFRAFYTAEWPCDVSLKTGGEMASPKWPRGYPPGSRCSWRITAPEGQRVRIDFTSFSLERHVLGHCNDKLDHVRLLDGGTVGSPLIGLYCAVLQPFTVHSTGRDIFIQFSSDHDSDNSRQGFHATFEFELINGSRLDNSRYIKLGDVKQDDWLGTELEDTRIIGVQSSAVQREVSKGEDTTSQKSTIWAVLTFLLLLVLALSVTLFLIIHHYRQVLSGRGENVVEDGSGPIIEELQLFRTPRLSTVRLQQFNNILDLSTPHISTMQESSLTSASGGASSASGGVCSSDIQQDDTGHSCKALNEGVTALSDPQGATTLSAGPAPIPPPRPRSMYGKYHNDNVKNINIDQKQHKPTNQ